MFNRNKLIQKPERFKMPLKRRHRKYNIAIN